MGTGFTNFWVTAFLYVPQFLTSEASVWFGDVWLNSFCMPFGYLDGGREGRTVKSEDVAVGLL